MSLFSVGRDREQPRLGLDKGPMTPLRFAQYQQWHDLLLAGPTRSVVGTLSNDFPGFYYYDPTDQTEHVVMFEGQIDWSQTTIERRLVKVVGDDQLHLFIGMFSPERFHKSLKMRSWKQQRVLLGKNKKDRDAMPDKWEALRKLTVQSFRLLPLPQAKSRHDWENTAAQCLKTLNEKRHYQGQSGKKLWVFFETFEAGISEYDLEPDQAFKSTAELICQAGLASALLAYADCRPQGKDLFKKLGYELSKGIRHFYDGDAQVFQNSFPPKGDEWERGVFDTWYLFHNLFHVLSTASSTQDDELKTLAQIAIERAIRFVRACDYQIPLFAKLIRSNKPEERDDGEIIGFALNPSVLGMYAKVLVVAAGSFPQHAEAWRNEATHALRCLRRWPLNQMFHQTVQLSWAAWAAHELGHPEWRDDFTRALLLSCYRQGDLVGLFSGCAGLGYPTFRESVEAIQPWCHWLRESPPDLPLAQIIELVLSNAGRFISTGTNAGLPQEGLATNEQPKAGEIGVAIYAAPQIFDLAWLQKQL